MLWSPDEEKKLLKMWDQRITVENIAAVLNRPPTTVRGKARRLGLPSRRRSPVSTRPEPPKVLRKCLKCRKEFMAEKQYFVCKECKAGSEWRSQGGALL